MIAPRSVAVAATVTAFLSGCGGGGGGGDGVVDVPFTSFTSVQPNQTVTLSGIAQTASGSMNTSGGTTTIFTTTHNPVEEGTLRLTYNNAGVPSAMDFSSPSASGSFSNFSCNAGVCSGETATSIAVGIDAKAVGWNYQTFGVWLQETGATTFQAGAMSAGAVTPATAIPTTGTFAFNGLASGFYVNSSGMPFSTAATMTATVDFAGRSIGFATTNTRAGDLNSGSLSGASFLDLNGTLAYGPGSNQFTGSVSAPGVSLTGSATGRFYGPAAEELGGTYRLPPTNPSADPRSTMFGGFGGRR